MYKTTAMYATDNGMAVVGRKSDSTPIVYLNVDILIESFEAAAKRGSAANIQSILNECNACKAGALTEFVKFSN